MDKTKYFYNDIKTNTTLPIFINSVLLTIKDFENFSNNEINIEDYNIFILFIYFNFFVGRFNNHIYKNNLNKINEYFFSSDIEYSYKYFIKNKKEIMKKIITKSAFNTDIYLSFLVNFEKYCIAHKNIGENFDKHFKELQSNSNFNEIIYNEIMFEYSNRLFDFVEFFNYLEKINLREKLYDK